MMPIKWFHKQIQSKALFGIILSGLMLWWGSAAADTLPTSTSIADAFKPGFGDPIGHVQIAQGGVFLVHTKAEDTAYRARAKLPLHKGDVIYTQDRARVRLKLNDGSILTLGSNTHMTLTKSVYEPKNKRRTSFISMAVGRARFWVSKFLKFKKSSFKVKTGTFVAGVRGSDFIIEATPTSTQVTTLENTVLEVVSLAAPAAEPVVLGDFQQTAVAMGGLPQTPVNLPPEAVQSLTRDMPVSGAMPPPGSMDQGSSHGGVKVGGEKKDAGGENINGEGQNTETGATGTQPEGATEGEEKIGGGEVVLEDGGPQLIDPNNFDPIPLGPEDSGDPGLQPPPVETPIIERLDPGPPEKPPIEEDKNQELPGMPAKPQT